MKRLVFLCLMFLSACSGKDEEIICALDSDTCACDEPSKALPTCTDYVGQERDEVQENCAGTFSSSGNCPSNGRVGTCKLSVGDRKEYIRYYEDAVTSEAACHLLELGTGFTGVIEWLPET